MEKRKAAVDCDDVVVDTAPHMLDFYNQKYGTTVQLSDFYSSNDFSIWNAPDQETLSQRLNAYLETDHHHEMLPIEGAVETLRLVQPWIESHVVTGRPSFAEMVTLRYIERHAPDVFKSIEFTNYYGSDTVRRRKRDVCLGLGVDRLVDDHLHHILETAEAGVEGMVFGNYPWNQTVEPLPHNVIRVTGWPEIGRILLARVA